MLLAQAREINASHYGTLSDAVAACAGAETCRITMPSGEYLLNAPLTLSSGISLIGEPGVIIKPTNETFDAIQAFGNRDIFTTTLAQGSDVTYLKLSSTQGLLPGDMILVHGPDDISSHANEVDQVLGTELIRLRYKRPSAIAIGSTVSRVTPVSNILLKDFEIAGGQRSYFFRDCRDITLRGVTLRNSSFNPSVHTSVRFNVGSTSLIGGNGGFLFASSTACRVLDSSATGYKLGGVFFRHCSVSIIQGVKTVSTHSFAVAGQSGDGITLFRSSHCRIIDNQISDSSCYGIWVNESEQPTVTGNVIENTFTSGIYATKCLSPIITDNVIKNLSTAHGVALVGGLGALVQGNRAENCVYGYVLLQTDRTILGKNFATAVQRFEFLHQNTNLVRR
ncbi:right-handed parallel beta-helix repeat-containing protein [Kamptonema cortianum]|nr:right-handed parallel beta-helix repeat-containing protein [Geitlerinema splendidum]MDK3155262.1 right-handed parallel beta-helix repeat-containing protein [Kamptonema cortianum]